MGARKDPSWKRKEGADILDQRLEDKLPLLNRLMRHLEPPLLPLPIVVLALLRLWVAARVEREIVVQEEVEVDHARTVPERAEIASEFGFDVFQHGEELDWGQSRFDLYPGTERLGLILSAQRVFREKREGRGEPHLDCCVEELVLLLMIHRLALVHPTRLDYSSLMLAESSVESRDGVVEIVRARTEVGAEADEGR